MAIQKLIRGISAPRGIGWVSRLLFLLTVSFVAAQWFLHWLNPGAPGEPAISLRGPLGFLFCGVWLPFWCVSSRRKAGPEAESTGWVLGLLLILAACQVSLLFSSPSGLPDLPLVVASFLTGCGGLLLWPALLPPIDQGDDAKERRGIGLVPLAFILLGGGVAAFFVPDAALVSAASTMALLVGIILIFFKPKIPVETIRLKAGPRFKAGRHTRKPEPEIAVLAVVFAGVAWFGLHVVLGSAALQPDGMLGGLESDSPLKYWRAVVWPFLMAWPLIGAVRWGPLTSRLISGIQKLPPGIGVALALVLFAVSAVPPVLPLPEPWMNWVAVLIGAPLSGLALVLGWHSAVLWLQGRLPLLLKSRAVGLATGYAVLGGLAGSLGGWVLLDLISPSLMTQIVMAAGLVVLAIAAVIFRGRAGKEAEFALPNRWLAPGLSDRAQFLGKEPDAAVFVVTHDVPPENWEAFVEAAWKTAGMRERYGAHSWILTQDSGTPDHFREVYHVESLEAYTESVKGETPEERQLKQAVFALGKWESLPGEDRWPVMTEAPEPPPVSPPEEEAAEPEFQPENGEAPEPEPK